LAFRQGMAERASILGDVGQSAPSTWLGMLGRKDIHVLFAMFCIDGDVNDYWREIRMRAQPEAEPDGLDFIGCKLVHEEFGARIRRGGDTCEPFGFRDGIGQPEIEGVGDPQPEAKKDVIAAGEFILGYSDVDGNDQIAAKLVGKPFRNLCENGTYMVFRKIEQHVDRFNADAEAFDERTGGGDIATRFVGRLRDGTSLAIQKAGPSSDPDDFDYAHDPSGVKCPFASHARRTNPRTAESRRHRIIRRGIPYENGKTKGMLFVCLNARIDAQFEFLQSEWCKKGDFLGAFTEVRDPITDGDRTFVDPSQPIPFSLKSYVTVRGGDYFFAPGIAALGRVASGGFNEPSITEATLENDLPKLAKRAPSTDESFDPIAYANESLAIRLLQARCIEHKRVAWASGKQKAFYYVACRDQFLKILADDETFTSDPYTTKLNHMLGGYDHRRWLRPGETDNLDSGLFQNFMLGMKRSDPEKRARLQLLKTAHGAFGNDVGPIAKEVVAEEIAKARQTGVLEIVNQIAYKAPLACAVRHLGFPALTGFSDTYKALYFERASFEEARNLGFIAQFPQGHARSKLPAELFMLVHTIALCLLIDQYETRSTLDLAKFAVEELLNRLAGEVFAEECRIRKGNPSPTLLSRLLRCPTDGVDPATFRARAGMIVAELVVGGVDTSAKGITNVVDYLLSNPHAFERAKDAVDRGDDPLLDTITLEALRLKPVADLIVRECPNGASLTLDGGSFQFEKESRVFLIPGAAMIDPVGNPLPANVDLRTFLLQPELDRIRRLGFGDGAHGCLGSEIVLAEIREVLKQLVPLRNLRRAAGPVVPPLFNLPVSLEVRFDP
jgi:Dyp-type peroxidase family